MKAYNALCKYNALLLDLGFQRSDTNLVLPIQNLVFLGVKIDTNELFLSLPHSKLIELKALITSFCSLTSAPKKQLQQLAGTLN